MEFADSLVVLNPVHGSWLRPLAEEFEIVWASTWAATTNALIGSRLSLPPFAHVDLGPLESSGTRKLRAVQDFAGDRSLALVDDELLDDAFAVGGRACAFDLTDPHEVVRRTDSRTRRCADHVRSESIELS